MVKILPVPYNAYYYSVTQIEAQSHGKAPKPSTQLYATGFFFIHQARIYLITNRHVVIYEKEGRYPDHLKFYIHMSKDNPKLTKDITIPLYGDEKKLWLEHIDNDPSDDKKIIDVAAIDVHKELIDYYDHIECWSTKNTQITLESVFNSFINVSLIGYPLGFYDKENMLPINRSGTLASMYGQNFNDRPRFLVDIITHKGCSGAPVYLAMGDGKHLWGDLLGVLSGTEGQLNLGYVWYSYLIPQIIEKKHLDGS